MDFCMFLTWRPRQWMQIWLRSVKVSTWISYVMGCNHSCGIFDVWSNTPPLKVHPSCFNLKCLCWVSFRSVCHLRSARFQNNLSSKLHHWYSDTFFGFEFKATVFVCHGYNERVPTCCFSMFQEFLVPVMLLIKSIILSVKARGVPGSDVLSIPISFRLPRRSWIILLAHWM